MKYINLKKLDSGGFCEVHICRREDDGCTFAKKTLRDIDPDSVDRFQREVRILSKLNHPRIVKVVSSHLSTTPLWYVMPLYKRSLAQEFPGIIGDEQRIRNIFGAILEGMHYAHEQGIVHRDLKPGNILLNSDDDVVISDFGLGRALDSHSTRVTLTGNAFGTPGYLAPEQIADAKNTDARSDVFALGRILYELYTGDNLAIQDVSRLPPGIALIVERCTRTDPVLRFQNAAELRTACTNLWVVVDKKTDEGSVRQHLANVSAKGSLPTNELNHMMGCLNRLHDNTDLMHEICINLPEEVIRELWKMNPHLLRQIVKGFAEQVAGQGWGFDYVDILGDVCIKICRAIDDAKVRALIIKAMVEVSISHNRWRVMKQSAKLLENYTSTAEDIAIAEALEAVKGRLLEIADMIDKGKLGTNVAVLFGR